MPTSNPLFTVLMPVYNAAEYLNEAIESILNQTISNFEFLIIDDGSTDKSLEIIKKHAKRDERIRLITRPNRGFVKTLAEGLEAITTDLVARMDADDISLPDRLEKQYNFLESHPNYSIVGCQVRLMSVDGQLDAIDPRPTTDQNLKLFLAFGCSLSGPTVMFRKNVIVDAGGFREDAWPAEDYECWMRIIADDPTRKIHILPNVLYHYRLNDQGISFTNKKAQVEQTNKIGDIYRNKMLKQGWKFLSIRIHMGWLDDLTHLDNDDQKYQLKSIYYALQTWFIRDQRSYSSARAFWNKCKLYVLTWLINREDIHFIKGQPAAHSVSSKEEYER